VATEYADWRDGAAGCIIAATPSSLLTCNFLVELSIMTTFTELQASPVLRDTYGVSGMSGPLFVAVAKGLKVLLAADGAIHPAELNSYLETCRRYGADGVMLRELHAFDARDATFEECFAGIDALQIPTRALLYDVIRIAKADGDYARGEQAAVSRAATMLGVSDDWVEKITALIDAENALAELRLRLLAAEAPGA
jgi:uncharacterized tellurite resistance protein B-like protein